MTPTEEILALLEVYRYLILIPLTIIEGPIVIVIAGFLSSTGFFDPILVYLIGLAGDQAGDAIAYATGRWGGKWLHMNGSLIGATPERMEMAKAYFREKHLKAITLSKLAQGVGWAGLAAAGALHVPFKKFIRTCFYVSVLQDAAFLIVGMVFGHAYMQIGKYLDYYAAAGVVAVIAIITVLLYKKIRSRS